MRKLGILGQSGIKEQDRDFFSKLTIHNTYQEKGGWMTQAATPVYSIEERSGGLSESSSGPDPGRYPAAPTVGAEYVLFEVSGLRLSLLYSLARRFRTQQLLAF
jgi:hypothetical protein